MAEKPPQCLFTSKDIACAPECPLFDKAVDRMGMNRWRKGMDSIELVWTIGRRVNPGDLPDPVSGTEFATFAGANLTECLYFQQRIEQITPKPI